MKDGEKCYSLNNEDFNHSELEDAINDKFDDMDIHVGDVVTIYEGDAIVWKAGDFADSFPVDSLNNKAYDEAGEYVDTWPDCTKEQEADLAQMIRDAVNLWADNHGLQPKFYRAGNVKEIQVKMTSEDGGYELVTP